MLILDLIHCHLSICTDYFPPENVQTKKNVIQEQEYFIKSEREGDFYPIILVDTIIWYMLLMRGKQEGSSGR